MTRGTCIQYAIIIFVSIPFSIDMFGASHCLWLIQLKACDVYKFAADLMGLGGVNWLFVLTANTTQKKKERVGNKEGVCTLVRVCTHV